MVAAYKLCLSTNLSTNADLTPCTAQFDKNYPIAVADHWSYAAIFAFAPVILAWVFAYALIGLWRWIKRGFNLN